MHSFHWWTDASRAFFCTSNAAIGKQLFVAVGMFDADFQKYGWEDLELGERLRYLSLLLIVHKKENMTEMKYIGIGIL